jgi:hypothetical protein
MTAEGTQHRRLQQEPDPRHDEKGEGQGQRQGQAPAAAVAELPGDVGAERHEDAVAEVEDADGGPDQGKADGHHGIERSLKQGADEDLQRDRHVIGPRLSPKYMSMIA